MPNFSEDAERLGFDKEELQRREGENRNFFIPATGLSFVDDHYGPRPGCLHTLLGSIGRGKSTLLQSLIMGWGTKAKMLCYLTEESFERLETKLAIKEDDVSYLTPKLHLLHEQDALKLMDVRSATMFVEYLRDQLIRTEAKILIIDNLTTSQFYDGQFFNANAILAGLRRIAIELQVAVFVIAHTKKGISEATKGLIGMDDVRGSASLPMTSDYFYVFYRIRKTIEFGQPVDSSFVLVTKSRDHENQDNFYKLDYDAGRKRYYRDRLVSFTIFKAFMKERDRA